MKRLFILSLVCLSFNLFAVERDATGSSYRFVEGSQECGGYGHDEQVEKAKIHAQSLANSLCWGTIAYRITEFDVGLRCIRDRHYGYNEHTTASARFRCNLPRYKGEDSEEFACPEGEFVCRTAWGNFPYCSVNRKCRNI